ncbi:MAG: hypothetical protein KBF12_05180 [Sebaldella sp.]|nr:hypothetical protein [Sebaldella sp.]
MKILKGIFYRIFCTKTMSHTSFSIASTGLVLKYSNKKYYYFQNVYSGKYIKVLREENGEEIVLYENWLDS